MKLAWMMIPALAIFGACGNDEDAHDHSKDGAGGHAEHGPNGGELIELGDHVAHLEVIHDEDAGTVTLYALDAKLKPKPLSQAPVLNLPTDAAPKQVVATAQGDSNSEWLFSDPALKGEPEGARLRVVMDGVTYTPDLPHDH